MAPTLIAALVVSSLYLPAAVWLAGGTAWIGITAALIAANTALCLAVLFRQGRIPGPAVALTGMQLALFGLLHWQIFRFLGPEHYRFDTLPAARDWAQLVLVHALRAVDLLDFLQAYGINPQNVHHNSALTGWLLLLMHVLVDVFLFGAVWTVLEDHPAVRGAGQLNEGLLRRFKQLRWAVLGAALIAFFLSFMGYFMRNPDLADPRNLVMWPLDNLLRVIDFGDAFQIFGWRLHSMPTTPALGTIAVVFRLTLATWVLQALAAFYLRLFRGRGHTVEDLAAMAASPACPTPERVIAAQALAGFGSHGAEAVGLIVPALGDRHRDVRRAVETTLVQLGREAIAPLTVARIHPDPQVSGRVEKVLTRIDPQWPRSPEARREGRRLAEGLLSPDRHTRHAAAETMDRIDPRWSQRPGATGIIPGCVAALTDPDAGVRQGAAEALGRLGPPAGPAVFRLIRALADSHGHVRHAVRQALERIDPDWRESPAAANARMHLARILGQGGAESRPAAAAALVHCGPKGVEALLDALAQADEATASDAAAALGEAGPAAIEALVGVLAAGDRRASDRAARTLERLGTDAVGPLVAALEGGSDSRCHRVIVVLGRLGPPAVRAGPHIERVGRRPALRQAAREALVRINPGARPRI